MLNKLIKPIASLFIAGEAIDDVIEKAKMLNINGFKVTISPLVEGSKSLAQVVSAKNEYKSLIRTMAREKIEGSIAVKLSAFIINPAYLDTAEYCISDVFKTAERNDIFVWIDMEGPAFISQTLNIYKEMSKKYTPYEIGIALQTSMKRTLEDLAELPSGSHIRLCKGAYKGRKSIIYKSKWWVRSSFLKCLLIANLRHNYTIATHDNNLLDIIAAPVEFQFLYGANPEKATEMKNEGRKVLIYLPYGTNRTKYCLRRLKENPKLVLKLLLKGILSKKVYK
jgi:proline dehydrogenase